MLKNSISRRKEKRLAQLWVWWTFRESESGVFPVYKTCSIEESLIDLFGLCSKWIDNKMFLNKIYLFIY